VNPEDLVDLPEGLPPRVREYVQPFTGEQGVKRLTWILSSLAVLTFFAFLAAGADTPANPALGAPTTTTTLPAPKASRIAGFNEVHFAITQYPGLGVPNSTRHFCGVHAATPQQQSKGLMNRTDLGGYDAMVFTFGADTGQTFFMKNTKIPLTVAFFDSTGRFLSSTDMAPCKVRKCPQYGPPGDLKYRTALEVQQGGLQRLGIGPGSSLAAGGGCV
jgi:uncharacterized membrane protein (UPF0127 family)